MSATAQLFKDMGLPKLAILAVASVALIVAIMMVSGRLGAPTVVPLYSGLDAGDSAKIAAELESMGIYYEMRSGGAQIVVPANKMLSARMTLAKNGLPSATASVGYEIFDKSDTMGASSFVNDVNLVRALEGELGRTISSFAQVERARVHLVLPHKDMFSRSKEEASASIVLHMKGSQMLEASEVTAISHLVATSVPGLKLNRITIVDTNGRPFKKGAADENDPGIIASNSEEFKVAYEKRIKNVIEDLLGRSVGFGKVEAQISAEMDFDQDVIDSETYDPDGKVARSVQTSEENQKSSEGGSSGEVSAANNLPGAEGAGSSGNANVSDSANVNEVTNYEISKTNKKHIKQTGAVKRLSIAVLVDGTYTLDEATQQYAYQPRTKEELEQYKTLVKSAVGFDDKRGDTIEVANIKFITEVLGPTKDKKYSWLTNDITNILQTIVIGIVITLILLLVVKPMVKRSFELSKSGAEEIELQSALTGNELDELAEITGHEEALKKKEPLLDMQKFEEKINSSSLSAINDIVERHPNEAVTIIRGWLENG
jgi:flagellar M-ring protein FliF